MGNFFYHIQFSVFVYMRLKKSKCTYQSILYFMHIIMDIVTSMSLWVFNRRNKLKYVLHDK